MKQNFAHGALVHFSTDLVGGIEIAKNFLDKVSEIERVVEISSIYKRFKSADQVDLNANLEFVIKILTFKSAEEVLPGLPTYEKSEFMLLAYDDLILMSPQLTLPYPELHTDPLIIRCSAEAWGQYAHPVYQKTLNEIARGAMPVLDAEFFLQGRSLIDI